MQVTLLNKRQSAKQLKPGTLVSLMQESLLMWQPVGVGFNLFGHLQTLGNKESLGTIQYEVLLTYLKIGGD